MTSDELRLRVRQITNEAQGINTYELVDPHGADLPPFTAGAHIDLRTPAGLLRQYSLCNDPRERWRYLIGVLLDPKGKGGSRSLHRGLCAGDLVTISSPRNHFALVDSATRYLLLAGGIGVTPMMSMIEHLQGIGADFVLHYCTRSPQVTAFRHRLAALASRGQVVHHYDNGDPARGLDTARLLAGQEPGTHLYYCGPAGFMKAVKESGRHWPSDAIHFEYFAPPEPVSAAEPAKPGDGFQVKLARADITVDVPPGQSIIEALRAHGIKIESSCEAGTCGTCRTRYLAGEPIHNDYILTEGEKKEFVMPCCAGSRTPLLVLDI